MEATTRTHKIEGGVEYITYQSNGWQKHLVIYDDGTSEEFYEKT